jgi:hypothetical protein
VEASTTLAVEPVQYPLVLVHWLLLVVVGAVPSMLMPPTVLPALSLPALSLAGSLVTLWLAPLPASTLLVGQYATPERLSVQVKSTVTESLYQPAAFAAVVALPPTTGAVRSILMPLTEADLVLPALSLMLADAPRLLPSPVMVLFAGWVAGSTPDRPSSPVHATLTSPLYQPAPLAAVVVAPTSDGAVLSMLMSLIVVELLLPAMSWASPWTFWSAPSLLTFWFGPQPTTPSRPESASEHSKVTSTSVLFQPKLFAGSAGALDGRRDGVDLQLDRVGGRLGLFVAGEVDAPVGDGVGAGGQVRGERLAVGLPAPPSIV